jgi:putative flippase GtrA
MRLLQPLAREFSLAAKFAVVSLVGFLVDYLALRLGLAVGLGAPLARLISLAVALQVTFGLSHWLVFGRPGRKGIGEEWLRFMVANGFGGACNYAIFLALTAAHWPAGSGVSVAIVLSSSAAYAINYAGTRLFVYGRDLAMPTAKTVVAARVTAKR